MRILRNTGLHCNENNRKTSEMFTTKKQFAVIASVIGIVLLFGVVAVNQRYKGLEKGRVQTLSYREMFKS